MIGHDPAPHREPEGNERWMLLGAFVLALVALVAIVLEDYEPVKLAPVFLLLAWFPLIALHELGHALVAKALGWDVLEIVIGFGRPAFRLSLFGIPCTVKMYPLGGYVRPAPTRLEGVRVKSALVYLAGPGAELLSVGALVLIFGVDRLTARTDAVPIIACQAVAVAALLGALFNLVPRAITTERGEGLTDGMGVLSSFTRPASSFAAQVRELHEHRITECAYANDVDNSLRACEAAHAALPGDPHLLAVMGRAIDLLAADDRPALVAALERRALSRRLVERAPGLIAGPRFASARKVDGVGGSSR